MYNHINFKEVRFASSVPDVNGYLCVYLPTKSTKFQYILVSGVADEKFDAILILLPFL